MSFMLWILSLTVLLFALRMTVRPLQRTPIFKLLFLPGVLFSTLVRLIVGALTCSKVKVVNPPWRPGEPVLHERSALPILGPGARAIVPFVAAISFVVYLQTILEPTYQGVEQLPALEANWSAAAALGQAGREVVQGAGAFVDHARIGNWKALLLVYLAGAILVYAAPNYREFGILVATVGLLTLPVVAVDWLGLEPGFLSRAWFIQRSWGPVASRMVALLLSLALLTTLAALVAQTVAQASHLTIRPRRSEKAAPKEKNVSVYQWRA